MNYFKKIGMAFLIIIGIILLFTFLISIFNYFDIMNDKVASIFKIIIPITSLFIGGFYIGKKSLKKGFIEGLKLGLIYSIILIIFNYLGLNNSFKIKYIIYYLILIISCTLGSMIGINIKKSK